MNRQPDTYPFLVPLGARVHLVESGETGTVTGRAHYINAVESYRVRYRAADGRQIEDWWSVDAISPDAVEKSASGPVHMGVDMATGGDMTATTVTEGGAFELAEAKPTKVVTIHIS